MNQSKTRFMAIPLVLYVSPLPHLFILAHLTQKDHADICHHVFASIVVVRNIIFSKLLHFNLHLGNQLQFQVQS